MNARNNTHSFLFTYTVYHIFARLSIPFMQFVHIAVFCIVFYFNLYKYQLSLCYALFSVSACYILFALYAVKFAPYGVLNAL